MDKKAHVIAFYLPQFHPIPENDEWWGKGFTEWTNVGKAKPLFCRHYQPRVPADLGYYDLRMPEVRNAQAELAKEAGIDAFCYWHYWFGNGKQLLEQPLKMVVEQGKPDFPFCLAWANHTWYKKRWNSDVSRFSQEVLMEQQYPGIQDIDDHFYTMLPVFRDKRYYKIGGKLLFLIFAPGDIPDIDYFISRWQELAHINGLPGFYFIGQADSSQINLPVYKKLDAINYECIRDFFNQSRWRRFIAFTMKRPIVLPYKKILERYDVNIIKNIKIYPTVYPNWDVTPRIGFIGTVFHESNPELFKMHVSQVINAIKSKPDDDKIIFLKSWNEWAEGNYMEPDLKFGRGYIDALNEVLNE